MFPGRLTGIEEENNRFKVSSLASKMEVVSKALLEAIGGFLKDSGINKWIRAYTSLHPEGKDELSDFKTIAHSYVFDNPYLMGRGSKIEAETDTTSSRN